jgi:hypothetical protein
VHFAGVAAAAAVAPETEKPDDGAAWAGRCRRTEELTMLIRCGYELKFDCSVPTPMLAQLSLHPSRDRDLRTPHRILAHPDIPIYDYVDTFGNICTRW